MATGARRLHLVVPRDNPEDALEPALRAILEATGAVAGAVCLFDAFEGVLRLAAEVGLSPEGCRNLRKIGLTSGGWAVPLQAVLTRRRSTFVGSECAEVPPLLADAAQVRAVACIPVHVQGKPRASIVLVADAPRALSDDELDANEAAIAQLGQVVEAIWRRSAALPAPEAEPESDVGLIAPATLERLKTLGAGHDAGRAAADALPQDADALDATERAHAIEIEHLTGRLAEAERACARERSLRFEHELRYERARKRADDERDATVRRARDFAESAEKLRAATVTEAQAIRAALAEAERQSVEARDAARRARAEAEQARAAEAAANATRDEVARALDDARAAAAEAVARRRELEAEVAALTAREAAARARETEVESRWSGRLAEAERAAEAERQRIAAGEAEHRRLSAELEETLRRERGARADLEAAVRTAAGERDDALRRVLEAERAAEGARAAADAELDALRSALAEAQKLILDAESRPSDDERARCAAELAQAAEAARVAASADAEAARAALEVARVDAARSREEVRAVAAERDAVRGEADRLAAELDGARSALAAAAAAGPEVERQVHDLRRTVTQLEADARVREAEAEARALGKLRELEAAVTAAQSRGNQLEADVARLEQSLQEAREREERARESLAGVTEDREGVLAHVTGLARAAEEARAAAAAEAEAIREALANAQALIIQAEDDSRRARADVERQEADIRALHAEREQLGHELEEARARVLEVERGGAKVPPAARPPAVAGAPRPSVAPANDGDTKGGVLAVIGGGSAFRELALPDLEIAVVSPKPGIAAWLAERRVGRVVINLAVPGGLDALRELRAEGFGGRISGCIAPPDADVAVALGKIETAARTLDSDAILPILARHAPKGGRLLAAGAPADAVLGLRQELGRAGVSMSIAWDAKQAEDLLPMVRPDVVIVDLALAGHAGHRLVVRLAALDPRPVTILLPGTGDSSAGFGAVFAEYAQRGAACSHADALKGVLQ